MTDPQERHPMDAWLELFGCSSTAQGILHRPLPRNKWTHVSAKSLWQAFNRQPGSLPLILGLPYLKGKLSAHS